MTSAEAAEGVDVLVAGDHSVFVDDVEARCFYCAAVVYNRSHAPRADKVVCVRCARVLLGPGDDIVMTVESARDVADMRAIARATSGAVEQ